ncbi:uncharacterized protein LOC120538626 [Polypterus senegalus]|uniref:uncharacterized protein LOC120538626 n=1 Tax=Polypterus senegalus TaxID=55291 RepID=UPI001965E8C8|nr:uncharacterized protein LOC120538626 [Polypterus senegalus]
MVVLQQIGEMLLNVRYQESQKYVKVTETDGTYDYQQFNQAVIDKFGLPPDAEIVYKDSSGTEVDEDIFGDFLQKGDEILLRACLKDDSSDLCCSEASFSSASTVTLTESTCQSVEDFPSKKMRCDDKEEAKSMVYATLNGKPGGDKIFHEYEKTKSLSDSTRRQLVNILVADMVEVHGRVPPQSVHIKYAQGIVALFPYLEDPFSKNGYEHFYDPASGSGYLAWRLKTVQRNTTINSKSGKQAPESSGGPQVEWRPVTSGRQLTGDECCEAISILNHSSDEIVVREKMKATFEY